MGKIIIINYLLLSGISNPIIKAQEIRYDLEKSSVHANLAIDEMITESFQENIVSDKTSMNKTELTISLVKKAVNKLNIVVYTNPVVQMVNIYYRGLLPIKLKLLTINGSIISITEINESSSQLDFSNNLEGIYILEISDRNGNSGIYQITKK
jgi:hypothetical protein